MSVLSNIWGSLSPEQQHAICTRANPHFDRLYRRGLVIYWRRKNRLGRVYMWISTAAFNIETITAAIYTLSCIWMREKGGRFL